MDARATGERASRESAVETIRAGLRSALRMLQPERMQPAREYVLNPLADADLAVLRDPRRLAGACGLRVRRREHGAALDLAFLLVPTINVAGYQLGVVATDRNVYREAAPLAQDFAVGRYIREEDSGEILFVSGELARVQNRDRVTIVWAGGFLGHGRRRRSFVTISCDAERFYAGRVVESVLFAEISTRVAMTGCDLCGHEPRPPPAPFGALPAAAAAAAAAADPLGEDMAAVGPPVRCAAHLRMLAPAHHLDFAHAHNNFSIHSGVTVGRLCRVAAPDGGIGVSNSPVIGAGTLLRVDTGLQVDRSAMLLGIAIRDRLAAIGPQVWPEVTPTLDLVPEESPVVSGGTCSTLFTSKVLSSMSPDHPDFGEHTEAVCAYPEQDTIELQSSSREDTPLAMYPGELPSATAPTLQMEAHRQFDSPSIAVNADSSERPRRAGVSAETSALRRVRESREGTKRASDRFVVMKPVPMRARRGEGLSEGTAEERRKESNRLSAARASARKKAYYEELTATLSEAKAEAVRLLRILQELKDENLRLRDLVTGLPTGDVFS